MSQYSLQVAQSYGDHLPSFSNLEQAQRSLFAERDSRLAEFKAIAEKSAAFPLDDSPDSLKRMEAWYFQLIESNGFASLGISRHRFEDFMGTYFCHVAVTNCPGTEWRVAEFDFQKGRFEIGVKRGLSSLMLSSFRDHVQTPRNVRRTVIHRMYRQRFTPKEMPNQAAQTTPGLRPSVSDL